MKLGGAHLVLATAPSSKAIAPLINGLTARGKLLIVAAAMDPLAVAPVVLLSGVNEIPIGADVADAFLSKVEGPDSLCEKVAVVLNRS